MSTWDNQTHFGKVEGNSKVRGGLLCGGFGDGFGQNGIERQVIERFVSLSSIYASDLERGKCLAHSRALKQLRQTGGPGQNNRQVLQIDLASTAATRMRSGRIALAQTERIQLKPALKTTRIRVARNSVYPQVVGHRHVRLKIKIK